MTEYSYDPNKPDLPDVVVDYVRERGGVWRSKVAQDPSLADLSNVTSISDNSEPGGAIATQKDLRTESEPVFELIQDDGTPAVPDADLTVSVDDLKGEWLMINGSSPGEFKAQCEESFHYGV
ncbi:hypothetical protein L486_02428 [Kwoniella mangroviensis CBS 10435]|uniref:Uncharacterized protein n=1 Tax=Kwoniella mangroviensis CBS 10435 TaxID=1331196 RepID=A0A1B9IW39_9TREE|nr:hypothetical protein L486_02428 [Kwoniella mangroviensis CBS 10435]